MSETEMTPTEKVIAYLAVAYPNANISAAGIAVYVDALKGVDVALLMRVAKQHILNSPFFPTVADLMRAVTGERLPLGANLTPDEAWQDVASQMPSYYDRDGYQSANEAIGPFLHGILMSVGGWTALQTRPAEEVRRAFISKFKAAKDQIVTRETLLASRDETLALADGEDEDDVQEIDE